MVVITYPYGQLGNRLLLFAHFMANAIEHGYVLCNPAFDDYAHYFRGTCSNTFCCFPPRSGLPPIPAGISRWVRQLLLRKLRRSSAGRAGVWLGRFDIATTDDSGEVCDLSAEKFVSVRKASNVLLVHGWLFRDDAGFRKHSGAIRSYFSPIEPHATRVANFMEQTRSGTDMLVGIHVRRGDYADFLGGKFFYSPEVYLRIMCEMTALFPGKRIRFLICSNEALEVGQFAAFDFLFGPGHELEDLHAFSLCDYIIGPPSTYTNWASYYGNVPLFKIMSQDTRLRLEGFQVYGG